MVKYAFIFENSFAITVEPFVVLDPHTGDETRSRRDSRTSCARRTQSSPTRSAGRGKSWMQSGTRNRRSGIDRVYDNETR